MKANYLYVRAFFLGVVVCLVVVLALRFTFFLLSHWLVLSILVILAIIVRWRIRKWKRKNQDSKLSLSPRI